MTHTLPELGYEYNALEPFIDAETMEIHYTKHHQAYVDKLNKALEKYPHLQNKSAEELISDLNKIPEDIRMAVRNHAGGHANHSLFWTLLKKGVKPSGEVRDAIHAKFGTGEECKKQLTETALAQFGSGWAWLVVHDGELKIIKTSNQDSPLSQGMIPILGIDVWEHSYYLKYQNKRADYIEAFFKVVNWDRVNELYLKAL